MKAIAGTSSQLPYHAPDSSSTDAPAALGDGALIAQLWPLLTAAFASSMVVPAVSLYIAPIARDLGTTTAVVGGLRAFSGVAALGVGIGLAPLIDRAPRAVTVAVCLLMTALATVCVSLGSLVGLIAFNIMIGATMAVLLPALQAASADRFDGPASGRAVAIIVSIGPLANILTGPLLILPSHAAGWRGAFVIIAVACVLVAALAVRTLSWHRPENVTRTGYRQAFAQVAQAPGAIAALSLTTLRSCLWFGWFTYLAAFFTERFTSTTGLVAWVWLLGASAFFSATVLTGRLTNAQADRDGSARPSPLAILTVCVPANLLLAPLTYLAPTVPLALAATVAFCVTSGATQAALSSLLIRRYAPIRGAVMGLNSAGMNVGMIAGATLAGLGLGFGGYSGLAATLVLLGVPAIGALLYMLHAFRPEQSGEVTFVRLSPAATSADDGHTRRKSLRQTWAFLRLA